MFRSANSSGPPALPGLPGRFTNAVHKVKTATQIFPPVGLGIGAGIGLGCGFGWPLRRAYGPPRALCGPIVGIGFGVGYGQGFGRRFGRDTRPQPVQQWVRSVEGWLDASVKKLIQPFKSRFGRRDKLDRDRAYQRRSTINEHVAHGWEDDASSRDVRFLLTK